MMCWMCDHPRCTHQEYVAHIRETIADYGWAVQGVERDRIHPPWAYTVGLTGHGKPELVVTGLPFGRAEHLLDGIAAHVMHADAPLPGERVTLASGTRIEIVKVADATAHLVVAAEIFGPGIKALQMVHADDRGHWPWDIGYRGVRGGQPVLGLRRPQAA